MFAGFSAFMLSKMGFYLALLLWNDRRNGKVVYNKTLSYTYFCNLLLAYYLDRCLKETETIGRYIEKI